MRRGRAFASSIISRIIVEGVRELENHHLTHIVIQVKSGNSHWKINLRGAFDPGARYFHGLKKCLPIGCLFSCRENKKLSLYN